MKNEHIDDPKLFCGQCLSALHLYLPTIPPHQHNFSLSTYILCVTKHEHKKEKVINVNYVWTIKIYENWIETRFLLDQRSVAVGGIQQEEPNFKIYTIPLRWNNLISFLCCWFYVNWHKREWMRKWCWRPLKSGSVGKEIFENLIGKLIALWDGNWSWWGSKREMSTLNSFIESFDIVEF